MEQKFNMLTKEEFFPWNSEDILRIIKPIYGETSLFDLLVNILESNKTVIN